MRMKSTKGVVRAFLKTKWDGLLPFLTGTVYGVCLLVLLQLCALILLGLVFCSVTDSWSMNRGISLEEKGKLYDAISSHRSDPELRSCEKKLAETHGKITYGDFREYENCISETQKRRNEEEMQRKLDSLGIWK